MYIVYPLLFDFDSHLLKISQETKGPPLQPHLAVLAVAHGAALNSKQSYLLYGFRMLFIGSAKNHVYTAQNNCTTCIKSEHCAHTHTHTEKQTETVTESGTGVGPGRSRFAILMCSQNFQLEPLQIRRKSRTLNTQTNWQPSVQTKLTVLKIRCKFGDKVHFGSSPDLIKTNH